MKTKLITIALVSYLAFAVAPFLFIEIGYQDMQMLFYFWPYPLFLALLPWIPEDDKYYVILDLFGFLVVLLWTFLISKKIPQPLRKIALLLAGVSWVIPLIVIQLVVFIFVNSILGIPIGE